MTISANSIRRRYCEATFNSRAERKHIRASVFVESYAETAKVVGNAKRAGGRLYAVEDVIDEDGNGCLLLFVFPPDLLTERRFYLPKRKSTGFYFVCSCGAAHEWRGGKPVCFKEGDR